MNRLIKWDPFEEIKKFFSEEDFLPTLLPAVRMPTIPIDIYEKNNKLYVEVGLPGLSKDDIKVRVDKDLLTIEVNKEEKKEEKEENYYRKEIRRGSFKRVIRLPYEVDYKEAKAEFHNGILLISFSLPKPETKEDNEIKIE
ncbi:MAG: Hsp20/alpha crystallin family protein [Candidatus Parcubacteria bacterium]|nr:MAG: Hsp20/alpha crystallin family protein [Candidatus Parcubacteria bacterium]